MIRSSLAILTLGILTACGGSGDDPLDTDPDAGDTDTDTTEVEECVEVPDPGAEMDVGNWTSANDNLTPDKAWPAGIVTDPNGPFYVQTTLPEGRKNAYFVFEAGADMELRLRVQNSQNDFKWLHLHDGNDCFGDEIEPTTEDIGDWYIENTFDVEEGNTYVMEVRVPGGGFF